MGHKVSDGITCSDMRMDIDKMNKNWKKNENVKCSILFYRVKYFCITPQKPETTHKCMLKRTIIESQSCHPDPIAKLGAF